MVGLFNRVAIDDATVLKVWLVITVFAPSLTRGTNSWLDNTDKNFGPGLLLLFKMHQIWSVDSQENY